MENQFEQIRNHRNEISENIVKSFVNSEDSLEKGSGEGSKGGKVIGHTKSGKPIYLDGDTHGEKYSYQDHYEAFEHHAAITDDWRTRQKHYGKQNKADAVSTRQKHLEFSRLHSVAANEGLKEGETREHTRKNGEISYHTKNKDTITVSNTNSSKK